MTLNLDKMKKKHAESQRGDFWSPNNGDTRVYVGPPCRPDDEWEPTVGLNFVEVGVHYRVGKDNAMVVCLNSEENPIIKHPFIIELLKKRGVKIETDEAGESKCPVCQAIYDNEMSDEAAYDSRFQMRFMWWVIPIDQRESAADDWMKFGPRCRAIFCGTQMHDGFMEVITENGDITQPDAVILAKINKAGKGMTTKYKVTADNETVKKPLKLDKATRRLIAEAIKKTGKCDLFQIAANMARGTVQAKAAIAGVKVDTSEDEPEEAAAQGRKPCFGLDYVEDEECGNCGDKEECEVMTKKSKAEKATAEQPEEEQGASAAEEEAEEAAAPEAVEESGAEADDDTCYGKQFDIEDSQCLSCEYKKDCAEECGVELEPKKKPPKTKPSKPKKAEAKAPATAEGEGSDDGLGELEQQLKAMGKGGKGGKGKGK